MDFKEKDSYNIYDLVEIIKILLLSIFYLPK